MLRCSFDDVFVLREDTIIPRVPVRIGSVTFPGDVPVSVRCLPPDANILDFLGHDLQVEIIERGETVCLIRGTFA